MKKSLFITLAILPALFGTSCKDNVRQINVYRQKGVVDKRINIRFFKDSPNVPYISVTDFYKEFFDTEVTKMHGFKTGFDYFYFSPAKEFLCFSTNFDTLQTTGFSSFDNNPNYSTSTGQLYIKFENGEATERKIKEIDLTKYGIKLYSRKKEAYVPLTLLSDISGGLSGFDVSYNGKDIYVCDYYGYLGKETPHNYFGQDYLAPLNDLNTPRPQDLINYNYNELCLVFDNFRGYTKQLMFGDEDLLNLGLDKLLSNKHPKIKEYLLSTNKANYYEGLYALFNGLNDGGHTGLTYNFDVFNNSINRMSEQDFINLEQQKTSKSVDKSALYTSMKNAKKEVLGVEIKDKTYYHYDSDTKTSMIGFDSFNLDVSGWDKYYKGIGDIPVDTDTYAYVRSKMYQAKEDGAENIVLDLTTNGGGASYTLEGILALFNNAKGYFNSFNVIGGDMTKENHLIDVNLDGKWDQKDIDEVNKFNFNVGVLTTNYAFSCGNLLPYNLKELGYKIIGEKTGGGSCAVSRDSTADGIPYAHSSYLCLTDKSGDNIDGGVEVDLAIPRTQISEHLYDMSAYYDFATISDYLQNAYSA